MTVDPLATLLPLAGLWALAVIMPGPNFLAITYAAAMHGRRAAMLTALGCLTGTAFWIATGLLGLKALFAALPLAGVAIKFAGAGYLVWTGFQMVRTAGAMLPEGGERMAAFGAYRAGLATTLANPKSAALAASLLAVALPPGAQALLAAEAFFLLLAISVSWYVSLALVTSMAPMTRLFLPVRHHVTRLAGAIFILFGLRLATER